MLLDIVFFAANFLLVTITALLTVTSFPTGSRASNFLALVCLCAAQVVLITQVLSEFYAIGQPGMVAGHIFFFGIALAVWDQRGRPNIRAAWTVSAAEMRRFFNEHRALVIYAIFVILLCALNIGRSLLASPASGDTFLYHLPRAYLMITTGSLHHIPYTSLFITEYPPNGSIYYMWVMLMRDNFDYRYVELLQSAAGLVIAIGIMQLARQAGYSRAAGFFAGLTWLTYPLVLVQMVTVEVDLMTAAPTVCFVLFALESVRNPAISWRQNPAIVYTGVAFGLAAGTKHTSLFIIPGITLVMLIYTLTYWRERAIRLLLSLGVSVSLGFALLGAYNYVLNYQSFGNFITSRPIEAASAIGLERNATMFDYYDEYFSGKANLARYVFQIMDWAVLPASHSVFADWNQDAYVQLDQQFDLKLESVPEFRYSAFRGQRLPPNITGFGSIGYLLTIFSPLIGLYLIRQKRWLALGFLIIGITWLIGLAEVSPWDQNKIRYLVIMLPFITAGALPLFYTRYTLLLIGVIGLLIGLDASLTVYDRDAIRELRLRAEFNMNLLNNVLPPNTRVGLINSASGFEPMSWLREDIHIQYIKPDYGVLGSEVDVILEDWQGACQDWHSSFVMRLPDAAYCIYAAEPAALRARFAAVYGWETVAGERQQALNADQLIVDGGDYLKIYLPGYFDQDMRFEITPPLPGVEAALCNTFNSYVITDSQKSTLLLRHNDQVTQGGFQLCTVVTDADYPTENVRIEAAPALPPVADVPFDLRFDGVLRFGGVHLPAGYEFAPCASVEVSTLWQIDAPTPQYYGIALLLVSQQDHAVIQQVANIFVRVGEPITGMGEYRYHIPVACDTPTGLYDLQMHVYNPDTLFNVPVTYPDGTPYQTDHLHLTTVWIRP